ncbi:MAG: non-canonical purine NTP pyrophosphatase [Balneolaceae bacterium]|nr:non-canonical purine NTP pyrophosphatase [Balneolaceae bacterium]
MFLATGNPDKRAELQDLLAPLGIPLQCIADLPEQERLDVVEDAPTLLGNAIKKARFWAQRQSIDAIADDTGLFVDLLDGAPGVYSARYAGPEATYQDNVDKLLHDVQLARADKKLPSSTPIKAHFATVMVWARHVDQRIQIHAVEGRCEGVLLLTPRGSKGFGYDPIFVPTTANESQKTFAELTATQKNEVSHRAQAVRMLASVIKSKIHEQS